MNKSFKILKGPTKKEQDEYFKSLPSNEMLCKASHYGILRWVKKALELGADIHEGREFALRHAASNGHLKVVKLLLEKGANKYENNNEALRYAIASNHKKIIKLLIHAGALNHPNIEQALEWAKFYNCVGYTTATNFLKRKC